MGMAVITILKLEMTSCFSVAHMVSLGILYQLQDHFPLMLSQQYCSINAAKANSVLANLPTVKALIGMSPAC